MSFLMALELLFVSLVGGFFFYRKLVDGREAKKMAVGSTILLLYLLSLAYLIIFRENSNDHQQAWLKTSLQALHLLGAMMWIGGLVGLTIHSYRARDSSPSLIHLQAKIKLFSKYAIFIMSVFILSGIGLTGYRIPTWELLIKSNYGTTLLCKLSFFVLGLWIVGYHYFYILPRLKRLDPKEQVQMTSKLLFGIQLELILAMIITVWAGILSTSPPPSYQTIAEPVKMSIAMMPEQPIINERIVITMTISQKGVPITNAKNITLEIWKEGQKQRQYHVAENKGKGTYRLERTFTEPGHYYLQYHVTAGGTHAMDKLKFNVR